MGVHRHLVSVVIGGCTLPRAAPGRRTRRVGRACNRPATGLVDPHRRAADKTVRPVVEVVGVEIINCHAIAACTDKVIGVHVFVEVGLDGAHVLVSKVFTDNTFAGFRVIRLANARQQHQTHIVELERAQDHQIGLLLDFSAQGIDIGHAGSLGFAAVQVDPDHMGIRAQLEVRQRLQGRKNVYVGRCLGIHVADITAAKTAEVARPHLRAIGVGVWPGGVCRRQVIRLVANLIGRFLKQLCGVGVLLRHQRKVVRTVRRIRVAALAFTDPLAIDGPGLTRRTKNLFGIVEERLQLFVADAEVLDGHVLGDKVLAVTLFVMAAHAQFDRVDPKVHPRPVQACTAHTVTRQESAQLAVGQGHVIDAMANGDGFFGDVLEQLFAHAVGKFVDDLWIVAVWIGVLHRTALQGHNIQAGFGQLFGHDRAGPTETNDYCINFFHNGRHAQALSPRMETAGKGYCSLRSTQSMKSARAPGKPIMVQPIMPLLPP